MRFRWPFMLRSTHDRLMLGAIGSGLGAIEVMPRATRNERRRLRQRAIAITVRLCVPPTWGQGDMTRFERRLCRFIWRECGRAQPRTEPAKEAAA